MDVAIDTKKGKEIQCNGCKSYEYTTIKSGIHLRANCAKCGKYIKNLPQNNAIEKIPFGKFKDTLISEITDLKYLVWIVQKLDVKGSLLVTIQERIKELS